MSRGRGEAERGSVAITVALSLTVLLGFAALVVDIGLNWATRTSAQTAADSAALAGASSLLSDGGLAAITTVEDFLNRNVGGLVELPDDAGWATDGNVGNGEVVCWTMPDPVPGPGAACPDGSNALQVTTPPIVVRYAFASVLGKTTSSIRARAAAGAGPAAPNNCVLCVLDPDDEAALAVLGTGGIRVTGGGIVVNSDDSDAAVVLASAGNIVANQIRVVGGVEDTGVGQLIPPFERGGPPVPDPLADLPTPDELTAPPGPPGPAAIPVQDINGPATLTHGVYDSINVNSGGVLTLEEGVYVVTEPAGFRVRNGGEVRSSGDGVTIYLACGDYPIRCDNELGARFRLDDGGQFRASPPASGDYAGLSIFADPGNTRSTLLFGAVDLAGAVYTASSRLRVFSTSTVQINSLLVVDRLQSINLAPLQVNYDPSDPLPGVGVPVLIQ
jgi:Putative Flp pilus-assembly TadE/G-like